MVSNKKQNFYGILTSTDWNSNKWQDSPKAEDIENSKFGFVIENGHTHTMLNFGHEKYPADQEGYYCGLLPQLWSKTPDKEKVKHVEVVFLKSYSWQDKQNYIVGLYAFPVFKRGWKENPLAGPENKLEYNVKARPNHIHLLSQFISLSSLPELDKIIPQGKELGKMGFNYLTKNNVFKILDLMTAANPSAQRLSSLKYQLLKSLGNKL